MTAPRDLSYRTEDIHFIRFVHLLFSGPELEVEYVRHGEKQGRIFDVDATEVETWLRLRGFEMTENLELAIQSAWNFGEAAYVLAEDRVLPL